MFCDKCGSEVKEGASFCLKCGKSLVSKRTVDDVDEEIEKEEKPKIRIQTVAMIGGVLVALVVIFVLINLMGTKGLEYEYYSSGTAKVIGCSTDETHVLIPDTVESGGREYMVTAIGDEAFENCREMIMIEIPDTVVQIGDRAFRNCTSLTTIELPEDLKFIGENAFEDCKGIKHLDIPKRTEKISDYAFSECSGLERIVLPPSIELGVGVFDGCKESLEVLFWHYY